MSELNQSSTHLSADAPSINATPAEVTDLMAELFHDVDNNDYLNAHGFEDMTVSVLSNNAYFGPTQCDYSAAMVIYTPEKQPTNMLAMVRNVRGAYEDVLIPGAKLAGCYGRIGAPSATILVVETFGAGMALQHSTGFGVAVALYAENIGSVALSLKQTYPEASLVVCAGKHEGIEGRSNMRNVTAAAALVGGLIAVPKGAATFDELYRLHGAAAVVEQVANATGPQAFAGIHASQVANGDIPDPPMLWPNAINGPSMMGALVAQLARHIVMTAEDFDALALWILFTYTIDVARVSPVLAIRSPIKRCGKTSAMTLLAGLVAKPYPLSNITTAVMFRVIDAYCPTLLLDESDTYLGESTRMMTGILNSGHTRANAHVARMEQGKLRRFSTFSAKGIAGIGSMPSTVSDRSITINLRRKLPDELVSKYIPASNDEIVALRAQIARWADDNRSRIADARPAPANLDNDRHEDNWEPLFAIAECLGGGWLAKAYQAAHALSKSHDEIKCGGEELLRDIQKAFNSACTSKLATSRLIEILCADREGPWSSFANTKPITPRDVSNLLADFDIVSKNLRFGEGVLKGYELTQFEDAFARYVRDQSS
jgi:putative DNA primase/helicase